MRLILSWEFLTSISKLARETLRGEEKGISNLSLELKWQVWNSSGWSIALKPGVKIPTGDEEKGFGSGRLSPSFFFITNKEVEPWAFHLNFGYIRNENSTGERTDLWHASLACQWEIIKELKVVANVGAEKNPRHTSVPPQVFILGE